MLCVASLCYCGLQIGDEPPGLALHPQSPCSTASRLANALAYRACELFEITWFFLARLDGDGKISGKCQMEQTNAGNILEMARECSVTQVEYHTVSTRVAHSENEGAKFLSCPRTRRI